MCSLIISCLLPLAFSCLLLTSAFCFPFPLLFYSKTASTFLLGWPVFTTKSCVSIQSSWWILTKSLLHANLTHGVSTFQNGFSEAALALWVRQTSKRLVTETSAGAAEILPRRVTGGLGGGGNSETGPCQSPCLSPLPRFPAAFSSSLSLPLSALDLRCRPLVSILTRLQVCMCVHAQSVSRVSCVTPWAVACQAPPSVGFRNQTRGSYVSSFGGWILYHKSP